MSYLVITNDFGIKEYENYNEMLNFLRQCTAFWCAHPFYEGEDFETLYKNCLEAKNFEDIAHVFEVGTYFKIDSDCIACELYLADKNTTFKIKRIL